MNPKSLLMFCVVLLAGVLGAAAAYQAVLPSSSADGAPRESLVIDEARPSVQQGKQKTRFAKCKAPAVLEAGKCVTEVVRTVTVPGSSGGSSNSGGGRGPSSSSGPQDDEARPEVRDDSGHGSSHDDDDDDRDDDSGTHTNTHSNTGTQTGTNTGSGGGDDTRTSTRTRTGR